MKYSTKMAYFHISSCLSFLLFICLWPNARADFFRDFNGNHVINGGSYFISRNDPAPDEGLITWANSSSSQPCPLHVIQSYYPISTNSPPSKQVPVDSSITIRSPLKSLYIPVGAPVEISFNDKNTPCKNKPLKWSAKPAKNSINAYYLVAGYDNPRYKGSFRVVDAGSGSTNVYRLQYCFNSQPCLEVGNSNMFPKRGVFGITSDPDSINFWALDFQVSKAASSLM